MKNASGYRSVLKTAYDIAVYYLRAAKGIFSVRQTARRQTVGNKAELSSLQLPKKIVEALVNVEGINYKLTAHVCVHSRGNHTGRAVR